jgi:glutamate dehydrogenase
MNSALLNEAEIAERFDAEFGKRFRAALPAPGHGRADEGFLPQASHRLLLLAAIRQPGYAKLHATADALFVVNDDMPFLVDTVVGSLHGLGLETDLVIHPVMPVARDAQGAITGIGDGAPESLMMITLAGNLAQVQPDVIRATVAAALQDVRQAVADWKPMLAAAQMAQAALTDDEETAFLEWLRAGHFTFLGARSYDLKTGQVTAGFGLLRTATQPVFHTVAAGKAEADRLLSALETLVVTKSARLSTVHRRVPMDVVAIKEAGRLHILLGLFTSRAYARAPEEIPLLRRKVARVIEKSGFGHASHNGKLIAQAMNTYARDELFQISEDELLRAGLQLVALLDRPQFGMFLRNDRFGEYVSLMLYTAREKFDFALRQRLEKGALENIAPNATLLTSEFSVNAGEDLARLHLVILADAKALEAIDPVLLEPKLALEASDWAQRLSLVLRHRDGADSPLPARYAEAFTAGYHSRVTPLEAVRDVDAIEALILRRNDAPLLQASPAIEKTDAPNLATLTLYRAGPPIALSDLLPVLEHFGMRILTETAYRITPAGLPHIAVQSLSVETQSATQLADSAGKLSQAFDDIWRGDAEDDRLNVLILKSGLTIGQVSVLRAFTKYLRQARFRFTQEAIEASFIAYPAFARLFVDLFEVLHDPDGAPDAELHAKAIEDQIFKALEKVGNADDDAIFRAFRLLIRATLRTNYFQKNRPSLAVKLDSRAIISLLPPPCPLVEIFVYSARFEAVHLRGGKIARGGIRWSDRREDFRTEILGLMKAQMVKNTVIVPVGSKGGFVLKRPPASGTRAALQEEGIACYKLMMQALLDITDNLDAEGRIIAPENVVRYDGDDPYLVVAADKGTASFSDIANGVSQDYKFWLDDAFASGGSSGYDHKKMGITARGAWESVKRHFREMGRDVAAQPFTVVGVGDMSGDVFGNAMLQSTATKLVAAFDHRHIFIDPTPDPVKSFAERQRLFGLPASSWDDYDKTLLSPGGGVFPRSQKTIDLTPEMRRVLGVNDEQLPATEIIRAILRAPVDLLFLGGIGTYIRAGNEANADVGDRGNDMTRIHGSEVRAAVIGEGANLGVTQRGRIEYAAKGGRINTDFIDNSAGVDTSDHEVNIKVLLKPLLDSAVLTRPARDTLLAGMTNDVAALVLTDNYQQTQTLSRLEARAATSFEADVRFMRALERRGLLDRVVEYLPGDDEIATRAAAGQGLTRPELAVLMAYGKITAYEQLLQSDFMPQHFDADLTAYFPHALQSGYEKQIATHKLRREIVMTQIVNEIVNRAGPTFLYDMEMRTGAMLDAIVAAYLRTREAFGLPGIWKEIEALDGTVPPREQVRMQLAVEGLLARVVPRLLRPGVTDDSPPQADRLAVAAMGLAVTGADAAIARETEIIPPRFRLLALFPHLTPALDLPSLASASKLDMAKLADIYVGVTRRFAISWLANAAATLPYTTDYERRAADALIDEAFDRARELTQRITAGDTSPGAVDRFAQSWPVEIARLDAVLTEAKAAQTPTLPLLMLVASETRRLVLAARG